MSLIQIHLLRAQDTPRPLDERAVSMLADSLTTVGLMQPIMVRPISISGGTGTGYKIIAGAHRAAAAERLGWEWIEATVIADRPFLETELMEIDENLCRAELTAAQRSAAIRRRKEIWEALNLSSGNTVPTTRISERGRENEGRPIEFAASTAAASGMTKRSINEHLARAEALGGDLQAVVGTSLDKGVELDALKALPAEQRLALITRAQAGEQVTARAPKVEITLRISGVDVASTAAQVADALFQENTDLAILTWRRLGALISEAA